MSNKPVIAVAVFCTVDASLYFQRLYTIEEVESVRNGTHPDISEEERVVIVHKDMTSESFT